MIIFELLDSENDDRSEVETTFSLNFQSSLSETTLIGWFSGEAGSSTFNLPGQQAVDSIDSHLDYEHFQEFHEQLLERLRDKCKQAGHAIPEAENDSTGMARYERQELPFTDAETESIKSELSALFAKYNVSGQIDKVLQDFASSANKSKKASR